MAYIDLVLVGPARRVSESQEFPSALRVFVVPDRNLIRHPEEGRLIGLRTAIDQDRCFFRVAYTVAEDEIHSTIAVEVAHPGLDRFREFLVPRPIPGPRSNEIQA
jgi:hypothetical protein